MKICGTPANFICLLTLFFFIPIAHSFAQTSSGPFSGSVFSDDNTIGVYTINSPGNAATSDNNDASASAILSLFTGNTHYLKTTGFGFAIPANAGITGIVVEVEKSATGINIFASVSDNDVRIVKNGTVTGTNHAKSSDWTTTDTYYSYGGTNDKWGTTWTPADINSAGFGIVFSAGINGLVSLLPSARIDHIRVTVYYNIILPLNDVVLTGETLDDHKARLTWPGLEDEDIASIILQRTIVSKNWETLYTIDKGTTAAPKSYEYTDPGCPASVAFYRLVLKYSSGKIAYSKVIQLQWTQELLVVYPNPANDKLFIRSAGRRVVECTAMDGRHWLLAAEKSGSLDLKIVTRDLPPGAYVINVDNKKAIFLKQ
jgi:hypothetical protein